MAMYGSLAGSFRFLNLYKDKAYSIFFFLFYRGFSLLCLSESGITEAPKSSRDLIDHQAFLKRWVPCSLFEEYGVPSLSRRPRSNPYYNESSASLLCPSTRILPNPIFQWLHNRLNRWTCDRTCGLLLWHFHSLVKIGERATNHLRACKKPVLSGDREMDFIEEYGHWTLLIRQ